MNAYAYYPGCSLKGSARHYEESLRPVFGAIGLPLEELEDWNCCGATAYLSVDDTMAAAVCGRNLSLAERAGKDILAPCAGCYLTLKKTNAFLAEAGPRAAVILNGLKSAGCEYRGTVKVRHPLEVLVGEVGLEALRSKVLRPLAGLKVACYYGCQLVRPYVDFDDPDHPTSLDRLMEAAGAVPVDFAAKTRCCGGSLAGTIEDVGLRLNRVLLKEAARKSADCIATVCPLCQFNLEITQARINRRYGERFSTPILYFSQLLGLALRVPARELGFSRSIIPLKAFWAELGQGGGL